MKKLETVKNRLPRNVPQHGGALKIRSRVAKGAISKFKLSDGSTYSSRRFLPVGQRDSVSLSEGNLHVYVREDKQWLPIGKAWEHRVENAFGDLGLDIVFKEIETENELADYERLRQFHYRGGGGAGRSVPIIGTCTADDLPNVIGFVELTSSMIANTARKEFFDKPYRENGPVCWNTWDRDASKRFSNVICRISRFVIHPEIRGLGLAGYFAAAARTYAAEKWHYGGYRPRFLEITADMLRYYPFISSDFFYIGETQGNEHRVKKDMTYLVRKALSPDGIKGMPQGGGGIMTLQRAYATMLLQYMKTSGASLDDVISRLQYDPEMLDQSTWEELHKVNRRPKPCYITGLTDDAQKYLANRHDAMPVKPPSMQQRKSNKKPVELTNLAVTAASEISQSTRGRIVQDTFGFVGSRIENDMFVPTNLELRPKEVVLISGASGSGKSLYLNAIRRALTGDSEENGSLITYRGRASRLVSVSGLPDIEPDGIPLDYMQGARLEDLLGISARCGLAEPQLLVRPIGTLSSGQRYRLQIALAILSRPDVLLVDNFCESLDRFSSRAVCRGLQSLAEAESVAIIVATAAYDRLENFFTPDQEIMLRRGGAPIDRSRIHEIPEAAHRKPISH